MSEEEKLLKQILQELQRQGEQIEVLRKKIEQTHEPILQALLEEYIKIKPSYIDAFQNLLLTYRNKSN
jgi:hypothetical protein